MYACQKVLGQKLGPSADRNKSILVPRAVPAVLQCCNVGRSRHGCALKEGARACAECSPMCRSPFAKGGLRERGREREHTRGQTRGREREHTRGHADTQTRVAQTI